jgi:hypothetical protein
VLTITHPLHHRIAPRAVVLSVVEPHLQLLIARGSRRPGVPVAHIRHTDLCRGELRALATRLSRQHADSHALKRVRWCVGLEVEWGDE